jgi:uncharacterized protein (DUF433 family)
VQNVDNAAGAKTSASDVRFAPAYDLSRAARYLHVPSTTIRNWFCGANGGTAVFDLAASEPPYLSFVGLTEAHVLAGIRRKYNVPLQRIRRAVAYLKTRFATEHPLLDFRFKTDGLDLFIDETGSLTNASRSGQTAMRHVVELYLDRIEWDSNHLPCRLYPFTQTDIENDPRIIVIDPALGFGRPMIRRTGISTWAISERFKSGESVESLARDFDRSADEIEAAIRSELDLGIAA